MQRDPAAVMEHLRGRYVRTDSDETLRKAFDPLFRRNESGAVIPEPMLFGIDQETRGIIVTGATGAGKSTLLKRLLSEHPAFPGFGVKGAECRILSVKVPSPATLKSLGLEILKATGWNTRTNRPEWAIWNDVHHRLIALGITVLHLDEAQNVGLNRSTDAIKQICANWTSLLQQPNPIVLILSGVEELLDLTRTDGQTFRRFRKIHLGPISAAADAKRMSKIVSDYAKLAGIVPPSEEGDLIARLIHAAQSQFGVAIEIAIDAIEQALFDEQTLSDEQALPPGDTQLSVSHFAAAYARREGCEIKDNVFLARNWASIRVNASHNGGEGKPEASASRSNNKKKSQ
ncbi:hypothetical protein AA309_11125 [Microvirga vignae]|uniref:AAA+ ATPase domain-containing protein n=2 Tax=Microvirga vignae TaxID=1225564 RepID=A0A0H1RD26_9HYPH|nr:hypothetical protein AA309_11125 [Microvirga vignae]